MMWKDNKCRCRWANPENEKYIHYHDCEWGVPEHDDRKLFEMLILESFQAGLSWECILNKREAFIEAFEGFNVNTVAAYGNEKIEEMRNNKSIVRNRLKIKAAIENAHIYIDIQQEYGSFDNYIWHWTNGDTIIENDKTSSELSDMISADLKKRGMKFVGTVIIYSYLQAIGMINSHENDCFLCLI